MVLPISIPVTPQNGSYMVRRPRRTDAIGQSLRAIYDTAQQDCPAAIEQAMLALARIPD